MKVLLIALVVAWVAWCGVSAGKLGFLQPCFAPGNDSLSNPDCIELITLLRDNAGLVLPFNITLPDQVPTTPAP